MITTFIFDMGGVLPGHTMKEYVTSIAKDEKEAELFNSIVKTSIWLDMDKGLSIDDACDRFCELYNHEYDNTIKTFLENFRQIDDPNPKMEKLISDLKNKGYKLYLMSNVSFNYKKFFPYIKSISYMDDLWVSCERKCLKPDKEAYEDIIKLFELKPEECFFIDDSEKNIEAANEAGIKGFVYKGSVEDLKDYIYNNLI